MATITKYIGTAVIDLDGEGREWEGTITLPSGKTWDFTKLRTSAGTGPHHDYASKAAAEAVTWALQYKEEREREDSGEEVDPEDLPEWAPSLEFMQELEEAVESSRFFAGRDDTYQVRDRANYPEPDERQAIGVLGDVNFIEHGGMIVWDNGDMTWVEEPYDSGYLVTTYEVSNDKIGNDYVDVLEEISSSLAPATSAEDLHSEGNSDDPVKRAWVWYFILGHSGISSFSDADEQYTIEEAEHRFSEVDRQVDQYRKHGGNVPAEQRRVSTLRTGVREFVRQLFDFYRNTLLGVRVQEALRGDDGIVVSMQDWIYERASDELLKKVAARIKWIMRPNALGEGKDDPVRPHPPEEQARLLIEMLFKEMPEGTWTDQEKKDVRDEMVELADAGAQAARLRQTPFTSPERVVAHELEREDTREPSDAAPDLGTHLRVFRIEEEEQQEQKKPSLKFMRNRISARLTDQGMPEELAWLYAHELPDQEVEEQYFIAGFRQGRRDVDLDEHDPQDVPVRPDTEDFYEDLKRRFELLEKNPKGGKKDSWSEKALLARVKKVHAETAKGDCFRFAAKAVQRLGGVLVHGQVTDPKTGRTFPHAWVEIGLYVLDESNFLPKDMFYKLASAVEEARFAPDDVPVMMLREKHWGPWVRQERVTMKRERTPRPYVGRRERARKKT